MPWIVASGTDSGAPVIVSITDDFRDEYQSRLPAKMGPLRYVARSGRRSS